MTSPYQSFLRDKQAFDPVGLGSMAQGMAGMAGHIGHTLAPMAGFTDDILMHGENLIKATKPHLPWAKAVAGTAVSKATNPAKIKPIQRNPFGPAFALKRASGADAAMALNQFAHGMSHNLGALKVNAKHLGAKVQGYADGKVNHFMNRTSDALVNRMAQDAKPLIEKQFSPEGVSSLLQQPGVQGVIKQHADSHLDRAMDMFNPFARKKAGLEPMLAGAAGGAALGSLNSYVFPTHVHGKDRTEDEVHRDLLIGAGVGGGIGAAVAPGLASGLFHHQAQMERASESLGSMGSSFHRAARSFLKHAAENPLPGLPYDGELHAKIIKAKGNYNKSRLRYTQTFRKLPKHAQNEILRNFDNYQKTVQHAVATGSYAGPF